MRKEFEASGVFKGMDGILFGETDAIWPLKTVKIGEEIVNERRRAGASEEEGCLCIFMDVGISLGKLPF